MNVDNIAEESIPEPTEDKDRLALMFERQASLMGRYHHIEKSNGFHVLSPPVDLDERYAQAKLKDFAWRVTEELGEATQALIDHPNLPQHFLEELSDAQHFLIELTILSGWTATELVRSVYQTLKAEANFGCRWIDLFRLITSDHPLVTPANGAYRVVQQLANAMNCLKNKPWKTTHMLTDKARYLQFLTQAWIAFLRLLDSGGLDADQAYRMYWKKSEVNQFRQRSNY